METTFVPENVTFSPGRVFINPSSFGCGSGCTYCYTKGFRDMQVVIKEDELVKSIKFIKNNPDFITGKNGTLISLSPDTDPFKTEESTKLTCIILENFLTIGNPIQISTKEIIPKVALEIIQKRESIGSRLSFLSLLQQSQKQRILSLMQLVLQIGFRTSLYFVITMYCHAYI